MHRIAEALEEISAQLDRACEALEKFAVVYEKAQRAKQLQQEQDGLETRAEGALRRELHKERMRRDLGL